MKITFTILLGMFLSAGLMAQIPNKMSYQALIRDADNNLLTNQTVGIQISILQGSASGNIVYSETLNPTTNDYGLVTLEFGGEAGFGQINWAEGPFFIKTDTDPGGGNDYTITGTSQLLSVPLALHALIVESPNEADPVFASWDKSTGITITESQISDIQDYIASETDPLFNAAFNFEGAQTESFLQYDGEKWVVTDVNFSESNHTHSLVTEVKSGFISPGDKAILDGTENSDGSETKIIPGDNIIVTGEGTSDAPYTIRTNEGVSPGDMRYWDGSSWAVIPANETDQITRLTFCDGLPIWGPCPEIITVDFVKLSEITSTSAIIHAYASIFGDSEITEKGICYSLEANPTTDDNSITEAGGMGSFVVEIPGLTSETLYYVRAYAINSEGTFYSQQIALITLN